VPTANPPFIETVKLTEQERKVLSLTAELWNEYSKLSEVHPDEFSELKTLVHQVQYLLARRVARRVDPNMWN
jgi:hypothetical protein